MTTPWTPPGEHLPEPTPASAPSTPPPLPLPKYPTGPPMIQGYPHAGGPRPMGPPPAKTMAGWALGLAVFGCSVITWILAVVFAVQVLVESRREQRDHGTKMAMGALVLLGGWAVVGALVIASGVLGRIPIGEDFGDDSFDSGRVNPSGLQVGDCLDDPRLADVPDNGDTIGSGLVKVVACDRPHDLETFLASDLVGTDYPTAGGLQWQSAEVCDPAFRGYVGKPLGRSELSYWVYYPTKLAWDDRDDRRITCVVGAPGQKTTGSLRDSRR